MWTTVQGPPSSKKNSKRRATRAPYAATDDVHRHHEGTDFERIVRKWAGKNPVIFECKEEGKRRRRNFYYLRHIGKANIQDRRPISNFASEWADFCRTQ